MSRIEAKFWLKALAKDVQNLNGLAGRLMELSNATSRPAMEGFCRDEAGDVRRIAGEVEGLIRELEKGTQ